MTENDLLEIGIYPALDLLPVAMSKPAAQALLVAIAMQESGLKHRKQIVHHAPLHYGPANGFWQFEKGGGVAGVMRHSMTQGPAQMLCDRLLVRWDRDLVYEVIRWNDVLAAGFARLLLWTLPEPLPERSDADEGWRQYMAAWRPGKPHRRTWDDFYDRAWRVIG